MKRRTGIAMAALSASSLAFALSIALSGSGGICETVVFCSDIEPRTARLLFDPERIMAVQRANGSQIFKEGVDYKVDANRTLCLTDDTRIPVLDYYAEANFNKAAGGKTSDWGLEEIGQVIATNPDLVVLAFGMNDGSRGTPAAVYKQNTEAMILALRAAHPDVGIVLVAEFSPNPEIPSANYALRAENRQALQDIYRQHGNMAFVDVGMVSRKIAARKKFQDFSGNNVNHPNDFLHRVYADLVLAALGME